MNPRQERTLALFLLSLSLVSCAIGFWPEISPGVYLNDNALHLNLAGGMADAASRGANPLDFWSPDWSFGYPVVRTYQPLAHALVVLVYLVLFKTVPLAAIFHVMNFLAMAALPLGFYAGLRLFEFPPLTAAAGALLAPLISAKDLYGLESNSYVWIGHGLFPQAIAAILLPIALGMGYQAVRHGRRVVTAGVVLALTALCQFMYGYMGALSILLMAALPDASAPRAVRLRRVVWIGAVAFALCAFQLVPVFLDRSILNRSLAEADWKWNSLGAGTVLSWLFSGELMDHGRLPLLSLLALAGFVLTLWRNQKMLILPAGAVLWILLFFGRPTWGVLMSLLAPADFHLHRFIGGVQTFLLMLAAIGLAAGWRALGPRWHAVPAISATLLVLFPMVQERAAYLAYNRLGLRENAPAFAADRPAIESTLHAVRERGGRAYAGLVTGWGNTFKVGLTPFFDVLNAARIPQTSAGFHTLSLPGDFLIGFDETRPEHYRLFNVRTVVSPAVGASLASAFLNPRGDFGPFRVYEAPGAGYFGVVDVPAAVSADRTTFLDTNVRWFKSDWLVKDAYLLLDFYGDAPNGIRRLTPGADLPAVLYPAETAGEVQRESEDQGVFRAAFTARRDSYLLFRMTWHPCWHAYLDGKRTATAMLSPGFLGVPAAVGTHRVELRYEPGFWKLWLALAGIVAAAGMRMAAPPA